MLKKKLINEKEKTEFFTPKTTKKKAQLMSCTHPGCKNTFIAFPHARFCAYHKDPSTRQVEKVVQESTMFTFKHNFNEKTLIERFCDCCGKPYQVEVYPEREDYPRYCPEHHSEYKRQNWRETHGKE
jgi:hypothetical protein